MILNTYVILFDLAKIILLFVPDPAMVSASFVWDMSQDIALGRRTWWWSGER